MNKSSNFSFGLRTYLFFAHFDVIKALISLYFCARTRASLRLSTVLIPIKISTFELMLLAVCRRATLFQKQIGIRLIAHTILCLGGFTAPQTPQLQPLHDFHSFSIRENSSRLLKRLRITIITTQMPSFCFKCNTIKKSIALSLN